jgi:hypothetical protein
MPSEQKTRPIVADQPTRPVPGSEGEQRTLPLPSEREDLPDVDEPPELKLPPGDRKP